jgi:hypothetical protein
MAITFDGSNDEIRVAVGACNITGAISMAAILRNTGTGYAGIIGTHTTGGSAVASLEIEDSAGGSTIDYNGNAEDTAVERNEWVLIAISKAAGTTIIRRHKYRYSTNVWLHEDSTGTVANAASAAGGTVRFGEWQDVDDFAGQLECAAIWDRELTDAEVENLPFTFAAWLASAPKGLWLFDQSATAQDVMDWTGGGANESGTGGTRVGTTVSTVHPPVFNRFDGAWLVEYDVPSSGATLAAALATATAAAPDATIKGSAKLIAALLTADAASPNATFKGSAKLLAELATASAASPNATVRAAAAFVAALAVATAVSPNASLQVNGTIAAALLTASAGTPNSTLLGAAKLLAALTTADAASPNATLRATSRIDAAVTTATAAAPSATMLGAAKLLAALATATAGSPNADILAASRILATLATASVLAPVATLKGSAVLLAAVNAATAASPNATLRGGARLSAEAATAAATVLNANIRGGAKLSAAAALATAAALDAVLSGGAGSVTNRLRALMGYGL